METIRWGFIVAIAFFAMFLLPAFYSEADQLLISGDILFYGSIGRTDLPMGNYNLLISGIKEKLMVLDDKVKVYCGHGPETTIDNEKKNNPYLV